MKKTNKKATAKLARMEFPLSSQKSDDPRTDLRTRGPIEVESSVEKAKRLAAEESNLAMERKRMTKIGLDEVKKRKASA